MWTPPADEIVSGWTPPSDEVVDQSKPTEMGGSPPLGFVAKQVLGMTPMSHPTANLPVLGAILGGGPGAALGETAKEAINVAKGDYKPTPGQTFGNVFGQGMAAGILDTKGFMGSKTVPSLLGKVRGPGGQEAISYVGKGLARAGQQFSGAKKDILTQATKQGYATYGAPSMESAQETFGKAIGPEGQAALEQPATDAFDPTLGKARATAVDIGTKLEAFLKGSGEPPTALEALQARQATDRIISATPVTDKTARTTLYGWRSKFDSLMTSQSGKLADASTQYRQAIVKDTLLNPTRITKSGEPSAFLPMVLGAGGRGVEGIAGMLTGTSPMAWGLGATTLGQISKTGGPAAKRAIISQFVDKFIHGDNQ